MKPSRTRDLIFTAVCRHTTGSSALGAEQLGSGHLAALYRRLPGLQQERRTAAASRDEL